MTLAPAKPSTGRRVLFIALIALTLIVGIAVDGALAVLLHRIDHEIQPERQVEHYLSAVVAGDVKSAIKLGGIDPAGGEAVLSSAVYKSVPDRVTSFAITTSERHGNRATVTAVVDQGDHSSVDTFSLHRARAILGIVPQWRLDEQQLPSIAIDITGPSGTVAKLAGVTLTVGDRYEYVLPGDYSVQLVGTRYFSAPDQTVSIDGFGLTGPLHGQREVDLTAALTKAGVQSATNAVAKFLDACVTEDDPEPADCPFALDPDAGAQYADSVWTLDRPTVSGFSPWKNAEYGANGYSGWPVSTLIPGMVDYTGTETTGPEPGDIYTDPFAFGIGGVVSSIDASGTAHFVFTGSDYNTDSDPGTGS